MKTDLLKSFWILFFATSLSLGSVAQNIKNERLAVKYLQVPASPLPTKYKSITPRIELYALSASDNRTRLTEAVKQVTLIPGFEQKESGGDLSFYAKLDPYDLRNAQTQNEQREETRPDKTVAKYTVYFRTYEYKYPIRLVIKDAKKDSILAEEFWREDYIAGRTPEFRSFDQLKAYWDANVGEIKETALNSAISTLREKLVNQYGYVPSARGFAINYVETKKVNYDDVVAAKDVMLKILQGFTDQTAEIPATTQEELTKLIDQWRNILKEANPDDRKARIDKKVMVAIFENIAYCHFFMRDFTGALSVSEESRAIDRQTWNFTLEGEIKQLKPRLEANKIPFK